MRPGSGWLELRQASGGSPMTAADARPLGEPGSLRRCSSALSAQFCIEAFVTSQGMEDSKGIEAFFTSRQPRPRARTSE